MSDMMCFIYGSAIKADAVRNFPVEAVRLGVDKPCARCGVTTLAVRTTLDRLTVIARENNRELVILCIPCASLSVLESANPLVVTIVDPEVERVILRHAVERN